MGRSHFQKKIGRRLFSDIDKVAYAVGADSRSKPPNMNNNKLKILPWNFTLLSLETLDLSGNCFAQGQEITFSGISLSPVPSLFELVAREVVRKDLKYLSDYLPHFISEQLATVKYCGCGSPCLSHCVPYTKSVQLTKYAQCVSYDDFLTAGNRATVKVVGYLCSVACHEQWVKNPNTLFTSKQRKRPREP